MGKHFWRRIAAIAVFGLPAFGQMPMHHMNMNRAGMYLMNMSSGTAMNPLSWPMPMWMPSVGSWNLMIMGQGFLVETQQTGPRGGDKFYSPNWFMASAIHNVGRGSIMFQTMYSLEPATITNRSYPLLFQTGETAFGRPLIDAQHPHDLFMALGIQYARPLRPGTMLQLYYAPVGDPALGPVAFPHRASAMELPQAPLSHHWQDSTHIANNVATVAIRQDWFRLEVSGFHGAEPNENRWNIDWGGMDSYSARLSVAPNNNWLAQVSAGHLVNPERQEEGNVVRTTASVQYTLPLDSRGAWSSAAIWGRNRHTGHGHDHSTNSVLLETLYPATRRNFVTGRFEWVQKDELEMPGTHSIQAWTAGYTRDIATLHHVEVGIGGNLTGYRIPRELWASYGQHPWSTNFYLRFRIRSE
jgi:hypothetical protein